MLYRIEAAEDQGETVVRGQTFISFSLPKPKNVAQFALNVLVRRAKRACFSPLFCSRLVLIPYGQKAINCHALQFWNLTFSPYLKDFDPLDSCEPEFVKMG